MARVAGEDTEEMDGKDFNEKEKKAFFFFFVWVWEKFCAGEKRENYSKDFLLENLFLNSWSGEKKYAF